MRDKPLYFLWFLFIIFTPLVLSQAEQAPESLPAEEKSPAAEPATGASEEAEALIDLDLKDADIKEVARALSRISGVNIIVSDDVKAKITLRVKAMDWREALSMVLGAYNLTMMEKGEYIVITTFERRRLAEESGDLQTKVLTLNFLDVGDLQKTLTSMLTSRGKIETDARTNSLVVTDIPERIEKIQAVSLQLDTKTPQVMIEAMMLTVKITDDEQLGVNWTLTHKDRPERVFNQDMDVGSSTRNGYITYGKTLLPWANISATIDFLLRNKKAQVLADPRVLTLDNLTAAIELVEQEPYTAQSENADGNTVTTTQFKDAPIRLYVKPHITKDNHIFMNIKTEQSYRTGYTSDNQPIIDSRKAETNVMVQDGETVVIGGLRKKDDTVTIDKFPILGDIPIIGKYFFRKTVKAKTDTELIIFVTPHIVTDAARMDMQEAGQLGTINEMKDGKKKVSLFKGAAPFSLRPPSSAK